MATIFTIGHSKHTLPQLVALLRQHGVTALADVRSSPFSRFAAQFNAPELKRSLPTFGLAYVPLGEQLGARSKNTANYRSGKVQYDLLAQDPLFTDGLSRVLAGAERHTIALMCAEKDPLECHRALLVSRNLVLLGATIQHIHADGTLESHRELERRMLKAAHLPEADLFIPLDNLIQQSYAILGDKVAYAEESLKVAEDAPAYDGASPTEVEP